MAKTKLLGASALTSLALFLASCTGSSETEIEKAAAPIESAVETLVTEAATRPGSELMAASQQGPSSSTPTVQEAKEFLEAAEIELSEFSDYAAKVYWIRANFITDDTAALEARVGEESAKLSTRMSNQAKRFKDLSLPADMRRKIDGMLRGSNFPAPDDEAAAKKLATIIQST